MGFLSNLFGDKPLPPAPNLPFECVVVRGRDAMQILESLRSRPERPVLLGAPARSFRETMRYQHRYRIENDPAIPAAGRGKALAEAMRAQEANVASSAEAWRKSIQDRDPLAAARQLKMPVLILHGLTARAVAPDDARLLEQAIRESGNRGVERTLFPGVNHHFQRDPIGAREGYDRLPTQDLDRAVLGELCSWLPEALK